VASSKKAHARRRAAIVGIVEGVGRTKSEITPCTWICTGQTAGSANARAGSRARRQRWPKRYVQDARGAVAGSTFRPTGHAQKAWAPLPQEGMRRRRPPVHPARTVCHRMRRARLPARVRAPQRFARCISKCMGLILRFGSYPTPLHIADNSLPPSRVRLLLDGHFPRASGAPSAMCPRGSKLSRCSIRSQVGRRLTLQRTASVGCPWSSSGFVMIKLCC